MFQWLMGHFLTDTPHVSPLTNGSGEALAVSHLDRVQHGVKPGYRQPWRNDWLCRLEEKVGMAGTQIAQTAEPARELRSRTQSWLSLFPVMSLLMIPASIALSLRMGFSSSASAKESACQCWRRKRRRFNLWVRKIPWSRNWQPAPVFWKIPHREETGGLQFMDHQESEVTEQLSTKYSSALGQCILCLGPTHWLYQSFDGPHAVLRALCPRTLDKKTHGQPEYTCPWTL